MVFCIESDCLSGWMDPPAKENKTLNDLCSLKSEKKLLPHVGGAVRLMQDWWVQEPFVPAVIGILNHSVWDQQPTTNFNKSIDILPNKNTICTQHWRSLSWQMVSHALRNSQGATTRWGGVTAGPKKGAGLLVLRSRRFWNNSRHLTFRQTVSAKATEATQ